MGAASWPGSEQHRHTTARSQAGSPSHRRPHGATGGGCGFCSRGRASCEPVLCTHGGAATHHNGQPSDHRQPRPRNTSSVQHEQQWQHSSTASTRHEPSASRQPAHRRRAARATRAARLQQRRMPRVAARAAPHTAAPAVFASRVVQCRALSRPRRIRFISGQISAGETTVQGTHAAARARGGRLRCSSSMLPRGERCAYSLRAIMTVTCDARTLSGHAAMAEGGAGWGAGAAVWCPGPERRGGRGDARDACGCGGPVVPR